MQRRRGGRQNDATLESGKDQAGLLVRDVMLGAVRRDQSDMHKWQSLLLFTTSEDERGMLRVETKASTWPNSAWWFEHLVQSRTKHGLRRAGQWCHGLWSATSREVECCAGGENRTHNAVAVVGNRCVVGWAQGEREAGAAEW